jgi:hypothetical protein
MPARPPHPRPHLRNSPFRRDPEPVSHPEFAAGDRISHDRHGLGSVVQITDDRMVVRFGDQLVSVLQSSPKVHLL